MELILISFGITLVTELLKFIHKKFQGTCWEWYIPHVLVFAGSIAAVIGMRVVPHEFIQDAVQIFSQSVAFYELFWKRIVVPALKKRDEKTDTVDPQ